MKDKRSQRRLRARRSLGGNRGREGRYILRVFRSNTHIYAQLYDSNLQSVLAQASSLELRAQKLGDKKIVAREVGRRIGERIKSLGYNGKVTFDRSGYKYHGRVRELAEGAREQEVGF